MHDPNSEIPIINFNCFCCLWTVEKEIRVLVGEEGISLGGDGGVDEWLWACGGIGQAVKVRAALVKVTSEGGGAVEAQEPRR